MDAFFIDELAWLDQLLESRPRLVMQHEGGILDPAWQALVLRPQYRQELLDSSLTYADIVEREYSVELRAIDKTWADSLRVAQRSATGAGVVHPGVYPVDTFASWAVGSMEPASGMVQDYKVFFEFADFVKDLTADRYLAFSNALAAHGFVGDSKIDLRPGQVRFQYNNIIVHAPSIAMAGCAEAIGLEFFGEQLLHEGRGVDAFVAKKPMDWHHFLLTDRVQSLPEDARNFLAFDVLYDTAICPVP
jgi:hypothetical protein